MIKIGEGKTASVYTDGKYAYKKYHPSYPQENIYYEVNVQNEIYDKTNLNVCKYEIDDHQIKMDLLDGVIFADRIRVEKYKDWLNDFIELQVETYQYKDLDLLDAKSIFIKQIKHSNLEDELKNCALKSIENIEPMTTLCHLDFHPLNIIYFNEKYYVIDWTNAKLAHPVMDIASTYIIFRQYLKRQANKYLRLISKKSGYSIEQIIKAIPVMAFIKLRENQDIEQESLLRNLVLKQDEIYNKIA